MERIINFGKLLLIIFFLGLYLPACGSSTSSSSTSSGPGSTGGSSNGVSGSGQ